MICGHHLYNQSLKNIFCVKRQNVGYGLPDKKGKYYGQKNDSFYMPFE